MKAHFSCLRTIGRGARRLQYLMVYHSSKTLPNLSMLEGASRTDLPTSAGSKFRSRCIAAWLRQMRRIWNHLPPYLLTLSPGRAYARFLHSQVCRYAERTQNHSTFFLRNRAELEQMCRLLDQKALNSSLDIALLACSKGAEVYSFVWTIRSARPDLKIHMRAIDISQEVLGFAERGVYSRSGPGICDMPKNNDAKPAADMTWKDQPLSIFERMTGEEVEAMFEVEGNQARIRPWLKEGIRWMRGDANDPEFASAQGPQDIVVANRFLCHMRPAAAERCLRNIAPLVKPGGYLFVSGIDLDVRTRVAREMGWRPVTDLIREVHEGDPSLLSGWPLEYWGLEPFCDRRPDWQIRYAAVFQIGSAA
jgi:chemotaxis methyl-accepting protein methylase